MTERTRQDRQRERSGEEDHTLEELRPLLVGPEQARLAALEERFANPEALAVSVSRVLPRAAVLSQHNNEDLAAAMQPLLVSTIHKIVRKNPETFAEAIFPAMGPAIRKFVQSTLAQLVRRIDEVIQRSLSLASIQWRIEAIRTGQPYAEIALRHSLVYRVEHVFLMHRETGLVLQHVAAEGVLPEDPDQISAMLTALDSFAREAFKEENDGGLSHFQVGELSAWVEHGPAAVLVAIIRGSGPEKIETILAETLEHIHKRFAKDLEVFRGEVTAFAGAQELLLACLQEQLPPKRSPGRAVAILLILVLGLIACAALLVGIPLRERHQRFDAYINALRGEPGLVVTEAGRREGRRTVVAGLKDPLATDPAALLSRHGLAAAQIDLRFSPFYSLDPRLIERRAIKALAPPAGVSLRLEGKTLVAEGIAPRAWIERARLLAAAIPGIAELGEDALYDADRIAGAHTAAATLEATKISFAPGSSELSPAERQHLALAAEAARDLLALAEASGQHARIEIIGHADASGTAEQNLRLSEERAANVAAGLRSAGVPADKLAAHGALDTGQRAREIVFSVHWDSDPGLNPHAP